MRARTRLALVLVGLTITGVLGAGGSATAYCDDGPSASGCSNSCTRSAEAWEKLTHTQAPWLCPM